MRTKFPYAGQIDLGPYFDAYFRREDAVRRLPTEAELRELARKAIVKDRLELAPLPADAPAELGDTLTLRTASALPKFNKERVVVTLGRGLYDRDLEEALAGKKAGESCSVTVKDQPVTAQVLEIKRKSVPEPTDEMVRALQTKDFQNNDITTVAGYEAFVREQKITEALSGVVYYLMQDVLKDYPVTEYDEEDLRVLGELEKAFFYCLSLERAGVDLLALSREEMQEKMHCDSLDVFVAQRHDWYKMKVQQCLIYLNILGLPCEGPTDPLDHYEVLSELQNKLFDLIKAELARRNAQ